MKRITYIVLAAVFAVFLTSCEGDPGRPGRDGRDGVDGRDGIDGAITYKEVVLIDVPEEAWEYSDDVDNNYFTATVDVPEITEEVFNYGIVKMYRTYSFNPDDQSEASQIELPYVRHKEYEIRPGDWTFYTETVDYDFYLEKIFIYYTASDFLYETDGNWYSPEAMSFRCVAIY